MTSRRAKGAGAAVLAFALIAVVAASVARDSRSKVTVQVQKVERRELVSTVTASGEVRPRRYVNVSAYVSGRITRLQVKEGDTVRKGQVLAEIDKARLDADMRQSRAGLEASRSELQRALADLDVARALFDRNQRLHQQRLIPDQSFDQSEAELKARQAQVEAQRKRIAQLEAVLESNQDLLEKATIPAPMDGIVTSLQKEEGEAVIGAQSFSPTTIMTVADLSVMEVEIMVDETDIRNVKLSQPAEVRVDALEGVKIQGTVTEIGASAIPRGGTQQAAGATPAGNQAKDFKVTVTLVDPPDALRPGLNATAEITTDRKPNALAVPIQAVVVRAVNKEGKVVDAGSVQASDGDGPPAPSGPKPDEKDGVFVVGKGKASFRPVKTGIVGETEIEIVDGLAEGEEIVSGSYRTLRTLADDARVKIERKGEKR